MSIESLVTAAQAAGFAMAPTEDIFADDPVLEQQIAAPVSNAWRAREVKPSVTAVSSSTLPAIRAAVADGRASVARGFWGFWGGGAHA